MRLFACLIVAPQRGYDEPAILSYAISSFCPTSADGLQGTIFRSGLTLRPRYRHVLRPIDEPGRRPLSGPHLLQKPAKRPLGCEAHGSIRIQEGEPTPISILFSHDFFRFLSNLRDGFDTGCSRFHLRHSRCREPFLIGRLGVAGDLAQAGVTRNRHDLVLSASGFREPTGRRLAESVCRKVAQVRHVALLAEPVAKAGSGEWLAELGCQERHLPGYALSDDRLQIGVHGDSRRAEERFEG